MSSNLLDQATEIGILRATGVTKTSIKLVYFYEALIVVLSSSLIGVLIGIAVGYSMALQ